jgi:hypothetical protein
MEAPFLRSHQNRKGAEVRFAAETRKSNLHRISTPKVEWVSKTWIPPISLVTASSTPASFNVILLRDPVFLPLIRGRNMERKTKELRDSGWFRDAVR